jgi:hypothetical protein
MGIRTKESEIMGDRAQIAVETYDGDVFLYTHSGGSEVLEDAKRALDLGRERWEDPEYLARIVFDTMKGSDQGTTGFGISLSQNGDLEHPVLRQKKNQTV